MSQVRGCLEALMPKLAAALLLASLLAAPALAHEPDGSESAREGVVCETDFVMKRMPICLAVAFLIPAIAFGQAQTTGRNSRPNICCSNSSPAKLSPRCAHDVCTSGPVQTRQYSPARTSPRARPNRLSAASFQGANNEHPSAST